MQSDPQVLVLVTDLDNTLWDWFAIWYAGFTSLLDALIAESGVDRATLETEIRVVHQTNGTSEYAPELLLPLLPSLRRNDSPGAVLERYDPAVHAYHRARKAAERLYPHVLETLTKIRGSGCLIVAYTESQAFVTSQRILRLGLDGVIDHLYSPPDHELPADTSRGDLRRYDAGHYELKRTRHSNTPAGERKPSAEVLQSILDDVGASASSTAHVGDSRMKDVAMAQAVGVSDVWAKYGEVQTHPGYELLRRVSHWPDKDVEQEKQVALEDRIKPTFVLTQGFNELLEVLTPSPPVEGQNRDE
jgi:FMN phosphatase YigB (HAD superfamily)